jgi:hypothetical protein
MVPLVFVLYAIVVWYRSRVDETVFATLLEVPVVPVAITGVLYILERQSGFSADLLLPLGLVLPGALFYWQQKRPQMLVTPIVGMAVLILALLMASDSPLTLSSLVFLAMGLGLAVWEIRSEVGDSQRRPKWELPAPLRPGRGHTRLGRIKLSMGVASGLYYSCVANRVPGLSFLHSS